MPPSRTPSPAFANSPISPVAPYPPLPTPEQRSRAPEFYGFVAWTSTSLLFVLYIIWGLLPEPALEAIGITWYPNREWSILLPAYSVMLVLITYAAYFALALAGTPSFNELCTITDTRAHLPPPILTREPAASQKLQKPAYSPYLAHTRPGALATPYDMPIGLVNRVMYLPKGAPPTPVNEKQSGL